MGVTEIQRYNVAGVLEDADSVTLADSAANLYGIQRVSDNAVIVAAGAAVQHPSTGTYVYDWTPLGLDPSQTYRIAFKIVRAGLPVAYRILTIAQTDSGRSLRAYRRALARIGMIGYWRLFTTTEASTSVYSKREVKSSALVSLANARAADHNDKYLYVCGGPEAGQQRQTAQNGYTPASGSLLLDREFATILQSGVDCELWARLPAISESGFPGIRELINRALAECWFVDRIQVTAVAGQRFYDLGAFPWLRDVGEDALGPIVGPLTSANAQSPPTVPGGARLRRDGPLPKLELFDEASFGSGDVFEFSARRPGNTLIKTGGVWVDISGGSDTGLVLDDDEALIPPLVVHAVALGHLWRALAERTNPDERPVWLAKAEEQDAIGASMKQRYLDQLDTAGAEFGGGMYLADPFQAGIGSSETWVEVP